MSKYYLSYDIDNYRSKNEHGFMLLEVFKKDVRVELKLAYNALFNEMLLDRRLDEQRICFLEKDLTRFSKALSLLANKPVSNEKMESYLQELSNHDLIEVKDNRVYLLRLM